MKKLSPYCKMHEIIIYMYTLNHDHISLYLFNRSFLKQECSLTINLCYQFELQLDFTGTQLPWLPCDFMVRNRNTFFSRQLFTWRLCHFNILNEFVSLLIEQWKYGSCSYELSFQSCTSKFLLFYIISLYYWMSLKIISTLSKSSISSTFNCFWALLLNVYITV